MSPRNYNTTSTARDGDIYGKEGKKVRSHHRLSTFNLTWDIHTHKHKLTKTQWISNNKIVIKFKRKFFPPSLSLHIRSQLMVRLHQYYIHKKIHKQPLPSKENDILTRISGLFLTWLKNSPSFVKRYIFTSLYTGWLVLPIIVET